MSHAQTDFGQRLSQHQFRFKKRKIKTLQVNLGKLCNLACIHCHVEAGPHKTVENMDQHLAEQIIQLMDKLQVETLDLTGGAPEMNPFFRLLVQEGRKRGLRVIDRCNLTILLEPGHEDLANFLAEQKVEVVASLPCYSKINVDKQRGEGTFQESIEALQRLNRLGYGKEGTGLLLQLVYNPIGAHLPPAQETLEADYKERLKVDFDIEFNQLFTITNMPITRYEKYLKARNEYAVYVQLLEDHFNPGTLDGLMCLDTLSISWDGKVYDCDFNQMLDLPVPEKNSKTIQDLLGDAEDKTWDIAWGQHCFGCTAGSGSSCQGALT